MDYKEKIDYSSINEYLDCPRRFFFKYVLNLNSTKPNLDLIFGSCWHYGMELAFQALQDNPSEKPNNLVRIATKGFNTLWELEGAEHFNPEDCFPKSPARASDMYHAYFTKHDYLPEGYKVIGVETPFVLDLSLFEPGLPNYIGRLDLVTATNDGEEVLIRDHKTAKFANQTTFTGYEASYQTEGYLTAGHIYYDKIPTIQYDVALCQKSKIDFTAYSIRRSAVAIDRFLTEMTHHIKELHKDLDLYALEKDTPNVEKATIQHSFPRRTGYACTKFFRACPFFDLCQLRPNALLWKDNPPQGFVVKEWDPDKEAERINNLLKNEETV